MFNQSNMFDSTPEEIGAYLGENITVSRNK